jgi:hypothetical protein
MSEDDVAELVQLLVQLQLEHLRAVKAHRLPEDLFLVDRIVDLVGSAREAISYVANADATALRNYLAAAGFDAEDDLQARAISGFITPRSST